MIGSKKARVALRLAVTLVALLVLSALAAPGARADCSLLDPLCTVEESTTTVEETVEPVDVPPVEVPGEVEEPVEEVLDDAGEALEGVVPPDPVGEVIDPIGTVPNLPGSLPAQGSTQPAPGGGPADPAQGNPGGTVSQQPLRGKTEPRAIVAVADDAVADPSSVIAAVRQDPSDPFGRLLGALPPVAAIGFPVALIAIVMLFLAVQDRIDRKDPKLALAPAGSEYIEFS